MRRYLLALLFVLPACSQDQINAALGIQPAQAMVSPGGLIQYTVTAAVPVVWGVVESGGGTISGSGLYAAPACPTVGTFHVSASASGKSAQATVTVVDGVATLTISPATVTLSPGTSQQFTATQTSGCGAVSSATMQISAPSAAPRQPAASAR